MTEAQNTTQSTKKKIPANTRLANSHYAILGLHPSASVIEIRRAYRELSKQYHPDTTELPSAIATAKFQKINEAYAILSNPERRAIYDLNIGYSRWNVIQSPSDTARYSSKTEQTWSNSAYLDPSDRPLSGGEIFVLFILSLTFIGCLILAITLGLMRGEAIFPSSALPEQMSYHWQSFIINFAMLLISKS